MAHVSVSLPPAHAQTHVVNRANALLLHVSDGHVSCGRLHQGKVQRTTHLTHLLTLRRDLAAEGPEGYRPDEIDHAGRAVRAGSSLNNFASGLARVVLRALDAQRKVPTTKDGCPRATGSRAGRGGAHRRAWERACAHPRAWQGAPRQLKGLCHRLPAPDSAFERGRKRKNLICFLGDFF